MTPTPDDLTRNELIDLVRRQQAELARLRAEPPPDPAQPPDPVVPTGTRVRTFAAALVALIAAAAGETVLRTQESSPLPGVLLYGVAALLLAATSARFVLRASAPHTYRHDPMLGWIGWGGAGIGALLALLTFLTLNANLRDRAGLWLWLATLAALVATGVAAWRVERPSPRWNPELPRTRRGRLWLWLALALIVVVAFVARIYAIDRIPFGINPDEGDRTATAMQVVRGTTDRTIFESGWYRISMMYFTLLARWLEWFGIGYVQARLFTALWGMVTLAGIFWLGLRQWGTRVGLLAGAALAATGLALQFSRETSEAGPTAALWTLSIALLLEGARSGRLLPWIGAGLAGGFSLYFYPSGRLWPLLAALIGLYLLVRWARSGRAEWLRMVRGLALAALAAVAVTVPFFTHALEYPDEFALRLVETSVLRPENAARLYYVDPAWGLPRLLTEQFGRSLGVFSRYADGGGFWPMHEPVLAALLAVLVLLGLGFCALRWRDPRSVTLALWFGVGMAGMALTVETPNVQRLATAAPALALFAALTLDEVVRRVVALLPESAPARRRVWLAAGASSAAALVLVGTLVAEARFYFRDYASMNLWSGWNQEGRALTLLPADTLQMSLGSSFHMVNSGWVRLLAPQATRGGVRSPGSMLPLPETGGRGLSFLLYPDQGAYLPWLRQLYPAAKTIDYALPGEGTYFTFVHVPAQAVAASRGALLISSNGASVVEGLGAPAAGVSGEAARWEAQLRVMQAGNYSIRLGSGPAELALDGVRVVTAPAATGGASATVSLPRGDIAVVLTGPPSGVAVEWTRVEPGQTPQHRPIERALLTATPATLQGFAGRVEIEGLPPQSRQENTLATCCLGGLLDSRNRPLRAAWEADFAPWEAGRWRFALTAPGPARLWIGNLLVAEVTGAEGGNAAGEVELSLEPGPLRIEVESQSGANGALEMSATPPSGAPTLLPGWALRRAPLVAAPLSDEALRLPDRFPVDAILETIE